MRVYGVAVRRFLVAIENWAMDDDSTILSMGKLLLIVGIPIVLIVGLIAWSEDRYVKSQPSFTLQKSEWACVRSHEETYTTYMMVGKVFMPMTSTRQVCDAFERTK